MTRTTDYTNAAQQRLLQLLDLLAGHELQGLAPTALADEMGVSNGTMSQVISGRSVSARIRARIAQITGYPVEAMWPPSNRRPTLRRTREQVAAARAGATA